MRLKYQGTVRLTESEEAERHAVMVADVREVRGQGSAKAQMEMDVSPAGSGSQVVAKTNVVLSGRAAQMGAGIVEDVATRLVADMAANLERLLESDAGSPAPPQEGPDEPSQAAPEQPSQAPDQGSQVAPGHPSAGPVAPAPPPPAKPINGFSLLLRALWHRLRHGRGRQATSAAVPEK
jgi:hypothetical protein